MKNLPPVALTLGLFAFLPAHASAIPFIIDTCISSPCDFEGGTITGDISLTAGTFNLVITATNNLVSGAITQLGFDFLTYSETSPEALNSFNDVVGTVTGPGGGSPNVNVGITGFTPDASFALASDGANAWAPGESIMIVLNTSPDLTPTQLQSFIAAAQIQGGCAPANPAPCAGNGGIGGPASYRLGSGGTSVPDGGTTSLLLALGMLGLAAARRRLRR